MLPGVEAGSAWEDAAALVMAETLRTEAEDEEAAVGRARPT